MYTLLHFVSGTGPINAILSWKVLIPFSRLTYCAYLVHPLIIYWLYGSMDTKLHVSVPLILVIYTGNSIGPYRTINTSDMRYIYNTCTFYQLYISIWKPVWRTMHEVIKRPLRVFLIFL